MNSPDPDPGPGPDLGPGLELDCRAMRCPLPVIELARRIGDVEVGAVLSVLATDPAALVDIPAWCRMRGQEFVGASPVVQQPPEDPERAAGAGGVDRPGASDAAPEPSADVLRYRIRRLS